MLKSKRISRAIVYCVFSSIAFFVLHMFQQKPYEFWYLLPNLFLAGVPLLFYWLTKKRMHKKDALTFVYVLLWLLFLPNAFYVLTDFVHLGEAGRVVKSTYGTTAPIHIFDVVMLGNMAMTGFVLGLASMVWMRQLLLKKFMTKHVEIFMFVALLASCFGLYLGRNIRLNSWDIVARPFDLIVGLGSVVFTVSKWGEILINTGMYFLLTAPFYWLAKEISDTKSH